MSEQMIARLLKQRDESRDSGDMLARAVVNFLEVKDETILELALLKYQREENFFVVGHAKAAKQLKPT